MKQVKTRHKNMLQVSIFNLKQLSFTVCTSTLKPKVGNPDVNHIKFRQVRAGLWLVTSSAHPSLVLQSRATTTTPAAQAVPWQHKMKLWRPVQGPTPTLGSTERFNSLQNIWPATNAIKERVIPALKPGRFSTAPLQTASGRHIGGCSSWPHESKRNHNAQGTKSKTGALGTKHKSTSFTKGVQADFHNSLKNDSCQYQCLHSSLIILISSKLSANLLSFKHLL